MSEIFNNRGETSKAEARAAKREAQKATREAAAAERVEQKAAKKAEREEESTQKKAKKWSVKKKAAKTEATGDAAELLGESAPAGTPVESEATSHSTLPAKVTKEKKPKKARKSSISKEVRRAIRPIRSKSQQTTARLTWAVFGMALVIVAIVGFWVVLSSRGDSTEVEVLVAKEELTEGNFLTETDVGKTKIDIKGGSLAYLLSSNLESLLGRVILRDVAPDTHLSLDMFGSLPIDEEISAESEVGFALEFPREVVFPEKGVNPGDRVVIAIKQGESPDKFIFEVIDVASAEGGTIEIKGSYERRQWWDRNLSMYKEQEGITFELEVVSRVIPQLCWRERFRQIQGIAALPRDEYLQLINSLECPSHFANAATGESESSGTDTVSTLPGDSVVERLENKRFSSDREVPSEFVNPAPIADGAEADGADESSLGDLGFSLPSFPSE